MHGINNVKEKQVRSLCISLYSLDSSVIIVIRLLLGQWRNRVLVSGSGKK
jgi:hypothetical protein